MATNLRLRPEAEAALRAEAERTHRTQQDLLREAVDRYLKRVQEGQTASEQDTLLTFGIISAPRTPYRKVQPTITLPSGMSSLDLLDRDDRF